MTSNQEDPLLPHSTAETAIESVDDQISLRLLADTMPQLVWSTRTDGIYDYFNQRWYEFTGDAPGQEQETGWTHVHPDEQPRTQELWLQAFESGTPFETEFRMRRAADGAYRWFLARAVPIRDAEDKILRWFGTCTDIDDQKRAELELSRLNDRESTITDALQGMVQPSLPETIPGLDLDWFYRPALAEANVGGDFCDVFPLEKGCYALVVGDLSGKGLAAAAQVATVRNMLRYALYTDKTIAEAITRLNHILITNDLISGFATLVVAAFDLPMKTITYVSCGQEPALLRRTANGDVDELSPTGPVLGMTEGAAYHEQIIPLLPGDTFALYTDGLTEAGPNRRQLLGVTGLAELLRRSGGTATEIVQEVISGAEQYANGVFHDDVCLLVGIVRRDFEG